MPHGAHKACTLGCSVFLCQARRPVEIEESKTQCRCSVLELFEQIEQLAMLPSHLPVVEGGDEGGLGEGSCYLGGLRRQHERLFRG